MDRLTWYFGSGLCRINITRTIVSEGIHGNIHGNIRHKRIHSAASHSIPDGNQTKVKYFKHLTQGDPTRVLYSQRVPGGNMSGFTH